MPRAPDLKEKEKVVEELEEEEEELAESENENVLSGRRLTRSQRKSGSPHRHHYFDQFSDLLRQDGGALSSTEIGSRMADSLLIYKL